ncbi:MAG TPA: GNAT family N-acetyltransferase [Verrucomicrobiae bacterium]|nr:GNAT family N-acetyltransferase [Verrucomicrobiae bacterium]
MKLKIHPLTPARWPDFEKLFGNNGACAGCWCMWWRLPRKQWNEQKGDGNRTALRTLVRRNQTPGLIAYANGEPVGWCAISPRESYPRLERSRLLTPVDDTPVWSVTCFFVAREHRRRGITVALLKAASEFARKNGATILEGYPTEPKKEQADVFMYTGLASAFRKAGFKEVARRSATRPIFRMQLHRARPKVA